MKRYDIIPLFLLIYLAVMAYFGRGMFVKGDYLQYFSILGVTLLIIIFLRWVLKRRDTLRQQRRQEQERAKQEKNK